MKRKIDKQSKEMQELIMNDSSVLDISIDKGNRGPIRPSANGPIVIVERARGADQYLEPKKEEPKKEEPKKEEEKPEEEKKEAPPADPTGRGPPTGPPARGAPRGPPGRGDPRGPPTGPPGRGDPRGPPTGPPGRGDPRGPPAGPSDGRGAAVPLAPTARGRGPAGRGPVARGGRGPAAKAEIKPTKPVIKLKSKMKPFFWKRVILPPDAPKTLIWKNIKEEKIDQDEIESLYTDAKANAPVKEGDSGSVKVRGPSKRTFFSGEENQKLCIGLNQLPSAENLIRACVDYDVNLVSSTQIGCIVRVWPKDSILEDLTKEKLEPNEVWEKGEAYMIKLVRPVSLLNRCKVWSFKTSWDEEKEIVELFHTRIMRAYKDI